MSLALSRRMHEGYLSLEGDPNLLYEKLAADYLRAMMCYAYPPYDTTEADLLDDAVRPGRRFPHRWVDSGVSTVDLAGSHWTLFAGADGARWRAQAAVPGVDVHELETIDDGVLVRPDGFVAWRGTTEESLQATLRDLGRL